MTSCLRATVNSVLKIVMRGLSKAHKELYRKEQPEMCAEPLPYAWVKVPTKTEYVSAPTRARVGGADQCL